MNSPFVAKEKNYELKLMQKRCGDVDLSSLIVVEAQNFNLSYI